MFLDLTVGLEDRRLKGGGFLSCRFDFFEVEVMEVL